MLKRLILAAVAHVLAFVGLAPALPVRADMAPVIVIPSRPGIPTVINGRNANYAVVEGDWGLARPGHMPQTVIGGTPLYPTRDYAPRGRYFPAYGSRPMRGRYEIDPGPGRVLPEPAEPYSRSWTAPGPTGLRRMPPRGALAPGQQDEERHYATPAQALPPTIRDPDAIDLPMVVVPQIRGRRP